MQYITAKLGNMRKAAEFIVYPQSPRNPNILTLQSDHRIAYVVTDTRQGMLSAYKPNGAYFIHLVREAGASEITVPQDVIDAALAAQPKSGDAIGPGVTVA